MKNRICKVFTRHNIKLLRKQVIKYILAREIAFLIDNLTYNLEIEIYTITDGVI